MQKVTYSKHQEGATLIAALIILLVMTMIGVAGMDETIVEQRMVLNFRDRTMALNASESSLRASESWLGAQTLKPTPQTTATCSTPPLCGGTGYAVWADDVLVSSSGSWAAQDWNWWVANTVEYHGSATLTSRLGSVEAQPRSVIEFREFNAVSDSGIASNLNAEKSMQGVGWHFYNIMGAGTGHRAETVAVIESTFKKWF